MLRIATGLCFFHLLAGKRYSLPNSRIMIHQPLGGAQGQQTDIEIQVTYFASSFVDSSTMRSRLLFQRGSRLKNHPLYANAIGCAICGMKV